MVRGCAKANTRERISCPSGEAQPGPVMVLEGSAGDSRPFLEMHDGADMIALLVCTSVPVSRKKS